MKKTLLLLTVIGAFQIGQAQLVVWEELNDTTFIYSLAGPGVTVSNLERNCATGASGFYNSLDANVGIDSGIALTSGSLLGTVGPNNNGSTTTGNLYDGDADLDALIPGYMTYDACYIEFDMTVAADTVKISYVFGSEEYLEYVGSSFNDVFAFWVSGPGIPEPVNIATIPGTDIPVAINNVNASSYSDYFVENGSGWDDPYMSDSFYIQYDGMTVVMNGAIAVTAGETYHMKIAVADAGDMVLDSGVFLKTGSLGSLRMGTGYYGDGDALVAAEECSNGYIEFTNFVPSDMDLVIDYSIGGTAESGIDYEVIAEQITIPAGMSTAVLPIIPIADGDDEETETIILNLYNPQSGYVYDVVEVILEDAIRSEFSYIADLSTVSFTDASDAAVSWLWEFGDGTTSTEQNPVHNYSGQGAYEVCLTITNANGCSTTSCKTLDVATGLLNQSNSSLQVFPNPATGSFNISPAPTGTYSIQVFNLLGSLIAEWPAVQGEMTIDCSGWTPGTYLLEVSSGSGKLVTYVDVR